MGGLTVGQMNIIIKARDEASRVLGKIGGNIDQLKRNIQRFAVIAAAAFAAIGGLAVKMAMSFDASMTKMITLGGLTEESVAGRRHGGRALGQAGAGGGAGRRLGGRRVRGGRSRSAAGHPPRR